MAETVTTTDDMIANDREKLKAFLVAEIKGWTDAVNDPASGNTADYSATGGVPIDIPASIGVLAND